MSLLCSLRFNLTLKTKPKNKSTIAKTYGNHVCYLNMVKWGLVNSISSNTAESRNPYLSSSKMFQESEHYEYQYFHGPKTRHKGGEYWSCLQGHVGFWWEFYGPSL